MDKFELHISKTFIKILIYISIMLSAIILFVSTILYHRFEKVGLKQVYENSEQIIDQLSYTKEYLDEIVRNYAINQYFNPNNQQLMYFSNKDYFYVQRNINYFNQSIKNNSMFHSALIYNISNNESYSTYSNGFSSMESYEDFINTNKPFKLLKPIPRILNEEIYRNDTEKVFTYVMSDDIDNQGNVESGMLILNVKVDWLLNAIKRYSNDKIDTIIIDSSGHVILDDKEEYQMFEILNENYLNNITSTIDGESKVVTIAGNKEVMTYKNLNNTDWTLVRIQSYEDVFKYIIQIKNETFITTFIFVIVSLILSILLSKLIYKPFKNIVKQIKAYFGDDDSYKTYKDDIVYISEVFKNNTKQIRAFKKYKMSTQDIIKENVVKSLLLENGLVMMDNKDNENDGLLMSLLEDKGHVLVAFNIDYYKKYNSLHQKEQDFIKFVITNISNELLGNKYKYNKAYIGKGQYVYIISIDDENKIAILKGIITNIQQTFKEITEYTLSCVISNYIDDIKDIHKAYQGINEASDYKLIYGNNNIIEYNNIQHLIRNTNLNYPSELEENLLQNLKQRNLYKTKQLYNTFIETISNNSIENIKLSLLQLSMGINKIIKQIVLIKDNIDFQLNYNEIIQLETFDEINEIYYHAFTEIIEESKVLKDNKHYILIKSIREYIQKNYPKEELSLQLIASEFKMSSIYLGSIFKENEKISIAEYINKIRFKEATIMLCNTNHNVKYIINAVGYSNESNFYKLFKKEYGLTPNNYRKKMTIEKLV